MKCIRKILLFSLLLAILLNMVTPAFASSHNSISPEVCNDAYNFSYHEERCADGKIIRKYNRREVNMSQEQTKTLLKDLGMNKSFIDELSPESLSKCTQAESIISVITYTRTNIDGNIEVVDQQTAMDAVAAYSIGNDKIEQENGYLDGGNVTHGDFKDSYMEICFMIFYMGDALYHFTVDATWLTEPFFRGWDSIGMSATHISIHNSTRSGWLRYDKYFQYTSLSSSDISEDTITIPFSDSIQNRTNGNWYGSGATFNLPDDNYFSDSSLTQILSYSNFKAHYEFDATIDTPTLTVVFNATASYDHSLISIDSSPSLTIGVSGVDAIILDVKSDTDSRIVELDSPITYNP